MSQWPMVKLGDVVSLRGESIVDFSSVNEFPFIGLEHMAEGGGVAASSSVEDFNPKSAKSLYRKGDLLFGRLRPNLRKVALADTDGICSTDITVLTPKQDIDHRYLYFALLSHHFYCQVKNNVNGINLPRINAKRLLKLTIPLPPLEEQRRISKVLAKSTKSIERERITIDRLKETLNAVFNQRFGSPYQNQKHLPILKLSELAVVKTGNTPPRRVTENYGSYIPWAKSDNLGDWGITTPEESLSEQGAQKGRIAEPGSILVTCIAGSINSIGKSSLIEQDVAFNQQINSLTPKPEISSSAFLFAALNSYPELVRDKSTGGVKGIVKKSAFEDIALPVPPMHEQHWFSQFFENLKTIVRLQSRKLALLEELHQSLATRAFAGQL
ncbi:restriction endonuclease subunit S [Corynebacterium sp. 212_CJEI]|uniref:restriction endonuclease subunit S n=1 Tax=Corynebacterium sp. 212_CJEI TaxID=2715675 RepID=UPI000660DA98|nr:restriction endonuclease subunit S [Corynebacterium sp. 212_CJEI]